MRKERVILLGDKSLRPRTFGRWRRRLRWAILAAGLASCAGYSVHGIDEEMRVRQAEIDVSRLSHAARLFRADYGRCPTGLAELAAPPDERAPYVGGAEDPWGRPYRMACPARLDPTSVDVTSGGPDGDASAKDNISSL